MLGLTKGHEGENAWEYHYNHTVDFVKLSLTAAVTNFGKFVVF